MDSRTRLKMAEETQSVTKESITSLVPGAKKKHTKDGVNSF